MNNRVELKNAVNHGFINSSIIALEAYKPRLLVNDIQRGEKVLTSINAELCKCDEFMLSVAFVTLSGVSVLINTFKNLEEQGIAGRILVSQYQNFTEPKALEKLMSFKNLDLRIITSDQANMHTKGYIFRKDEMFTISIGSSNLTQNALCENQEWNLMVSATKEGSLVKDTMNEFEFLFDQAIIVDQDWINEYNQIYQLSKLFNQKSHAIATKKITKQSAIKPNKMQDEALRSLTDFRSKGLDKSLIISATGTGKTYLSAFDVRNFNPEKFLFIVHREQIAKDAMKSYKRVLGYDKKMTLLCGGKMANSDFVFAMIQTLSKTEIMEGFKPDEFDYIVFDEVHRAGAKSYQKVFDYFKPKFLLGMSATPERTDDFDIFKMFDYQVAYEIRLQEAMKEKMICPFHYFGISELIIDGELIEDKTEFNKLTSDARVHYIIEQIEFYGFSGDRIKGLIFCSRNEEAIALSNKFNQLGYRSCALSGIDNQAEREIAIEQLEQDTDEEALDFIFTVDIFNEGIDIPSINQIVMLRPTQSAIVFVQQLGRGLRKKENKEYVVVIDFIGNYENNFLIPIALSGDQSYNKDTIRRFVTEGNRVIPGCSTINFDNITRERIFASIDHANFNETKRIKESYQSLKQRLGRIPKLEEFAEHGSIDIIRIFDKFGSYHNFLSKYEDDYKLKLSSLEQQFIEIISIKYVCGKRPHELEFLKLVVEKNLKLTSQFKILMNRNYPKLKITEHTLVCVVNQMLQNFTSGSARDTYKDAIFIKKSTNNDYQISDELKQALNSAEFKNMFMDLIKLGIERNTRLYGNRYQDTCFELYQKYTYDDVCRCLDWPKGEVALNIGGYKYNRETNTYPVFMNYHKDDDVDDTINYEDRFLSPSHLIAISKSGRTINSDDVKQALTSKENGTDLCLFVRRNKDDKISKEFYYLGRMHADTANKPNAITMPKTTKTAIEIFYQLETPVRDDIYDYIVG